MLSKKKLSNIAVRTRKIYLYKMCLICSDMSFPGPAEIRFQKNGGKRHYHNEIKPVKDVRSLKTQHFMD